MSRAPGITFEIPLRVPADVLPRMDVAGFVGFAACGPVHVPVPIESVARFRDVFGPDVPLGRDPETGRAHASYLGSAVEAFFANGGLRCWVVRVARPRPPSAFEIQGVVGLGRGRWTLAGAVARSQGSWADLTTLGCVGNVAWLPTAPVGRLLQAAAGWVRLAPSALVVPGDVLRLTLPGGGFAVSVRGVTEEPGARLVSWDPAETVWLTLPDPAGPALSEVVRLTRGEPVAVAADVVAEPVPGRYRVRLAEEGPPSSAPSSVLSPGDVLRARSGADTLLLPVGEALAPRAGEGPGTVVAAGPGWIVAVGASPPPWALVADAVPVVERLSVDLVVWQGETLSARLADLGLTAAHPRSLLALPTDEALFRELPKPPRQLWDETLTPRFPLATELPKLDDPAASQPSEPGAAPASEPSEPPVVWLPLAVPLAPDPAQARPPLGDHAPESALYRDGLDGFGPDLFVDEALAEVGTATLGRVADDRAFLSRPAEPLRGLHALYPLDEVTLACVPDAAQPGWERRPIEPPPAPLPPVLELTGGELRWSAVGAAYRLEQAATPDFRDAGVRYEGPATRFELGEFQGCSVWRYFRVRAAAAGPWSNTVSALLPPSDFDDCHPPPQAPRLSLTDELTWTDVGTDGYEAQTSPDPAFSEGSQSVVVRALRLDLPKTIETTTFYRVRGTGGPWSNTVVQVPPPRPAWVIRPDAPRGPNEGLLAVQRALVRLCAARQDMIAVLALPHGHARERALDHVAALATSAPPTVPVPVPPLTGDEVDGLGYAAVYHPWIMVRDGEEIRSLPPEGAACGGIARRTLARGAWIAPANEPLTGVLGLDPPLTRPDRAGLVESSVNALAEEPRGFVVAIADTLARERETRPLNVRRLLILIRRLVLRQAVTYVFEPGGTTLRNSVVRRFDTLMAGLYLRGAFQGATAREAYRVVADASNNPREGLDAGRFVVDLMVAPSRPLTFLRIRLVQSGPAAVTVEGV
ncbi:hypothetical protein AB0L65_59440 [Nonomuraea sp. NPDC052116]|uniref:hypothetical protein n=1 Tax=Nonomuraea sp. NPDC052116 TaxID=3155665 RepID=UPI0034360EFB